MNEFRFSGEAGTWEYKPHHFWMAGEEVCSKLSNCFTANNETNYGNVDIFLTLCF